jgi:ribose 5-phosphate isomerase B
MRLALGSDHAGYKIKEAIKAALSKAGHGVEDFGAASEERSDYPDFARGVAAAVDEGRADRGVLVCGTGIGMCIAANRFPGVRAAVLRDEADVEMARLHNDANVACIGARRTAEGEALRLVEKFLSTGFEGGRHEARVAKLRSMR